MADIKVILVTEGAKLLKQIGACALAEVGKAATAWANRTRDDGDEEEEDYEDYDEYVDEKFEYNTADEEEYTEEEEDVIKN